LWSGQGVAASRKCQCHRDDPNETSEYVKVEWWSYTMTDGQIRDSEVATTDVMPRPLLALINPVDWYQPRTVTAPADATHILASPADYKASMFATLHPELSWEFVRQWYSFKA
jgi:hypothetical protein